MPKLVFTVIHREEWKGDFEKRAYHVRGRGGVYIGIGDNDVYIGMSDRNKDGILSRISTHFRDRGKDLIKYFIVVTSVDIHDDSFDSTVIASLEHSLRQMAVYCDRANVINVAPTHYLIRNDVFKLKDFLQAYAVIYDMIRDRGVSHLTPRHMNVNYSADPSSFILKGSSVKLFKAGDNELIVLKNSSFDFPANVALDNSELDRVFRQLIRDNYVVVAPPSNGRGRMLVTRDIPTSRDLPLSLLTSLFLNEEVDKYDSHWGNSYNTTLLTSIDGNHDR